MAEAASRPQNGKIGRVLGHSEDIIYNLFIHLFIYLPINCLHLFLCVKDVSSPEAVVMGSLQISFRLESG